MIRLSRVLYVAVAALTLATAALRSDPAGAGEPAISAAGHAESRRAAGAGDAPRSGFGRSIDIVCRDGRHSTWDDLKAPGRGRLITCPPDTDAATGFAR